MGKLTDTQVRKQVDAAVARLLRHDAHLLKYDVNERSMSHRLAMYLQDEFPRWHVDCEYNRNHDDQKRLRLPTHKLLVEGEVPFYDPEAKTVYPDIIVHRRSTNDNLLVIKIKKTTSRVDNDFDKEKLQAFKDQLGYRHAVFLKLKTGNGNSGIEKPEWIENTHSAHPTPHTPRPT